MTVPMFLKGSKLNAHVAKEVTELNPILTVLKSGGEFKPEHVNALRHQIGRQMLCLTDVDSSKIDVPVIYLKHDLPGWWSKMEMFNPAFELSNFLYVDLDTIIFSSPSIEANKDNPIVVLEDFYHPERGIGSGLMGFYNSEDIKHDIWKEFIRDPVYHMDSCGIYGDQKFLDPFLFKKPYTSTWQSLVPGEVLSYKKDILSNKTESSKITAALDASIICFHGKPRPWNVDESWINKKYYRR